MIFSEQNKQVDCLHYLAGNEFYLHGQPNIRGEIKTYPEDFIVEEQLEFEPSGEGEHLFLQIRKTLLNTQDVVGLLSSRFSVSQKKIAYSGLKDKVGITTQWFSIQLPRGFKAGDSQALESLYASNLLDDRKREEREEYKQAEAVILRASWHRKKLKFGVHKQNYFEVIVRNLEQHGDFREHSLSDSLKQQITKLTQYGVPNYYGLQRFGHQWVRGTEEGKALTNNVVKALNTFRAEKPVKLSRSKRSIYISALRSFLFNKIVSARIERQTFTQVKKGDHLKLNASESEFVVSEGDDLADLQQRVLTGDLHLAAPLYGDRHKDRNKEGKTKSLETKNFDNLSESIFEQYSEITSLLKKLNTELAYRSIRFIPHEVKVEWLDELAVKLSFELPKGAYATSLLRELVIIEKAIHGNTQ